VGLDEQKVKKYIKNQQDQDSIMDRYDIDLVKDPFRGASKKMKEDGEGIMPKPSVIEQR